MKRVEAIRVCVTVVALRAIGTALRLFSSAFYAILPWQTESGRVWSREPFL
jgi:hypothetical protein